MRKLAKWLDSLTIGIGIGFTVLACVNGNVQQCVSTIAIVRGAINQEAPDATPDLPTP